MAIVGSFTSRPHAAMAAAMLEAHGITAAVLGDDAGGTAPHVNMALGGGYAISVPDADRDEAVALLAVDDIEPTPRPRDRADVLRTILRVTLAVFVLLVAASLLGVLG